MEKWEGKSKNPGALVNRHHPVHQIKLESSWTRHWFEYDLFSIICSYLPVDETCFIKLFIKHGTHLDIFYQNASYASPTSNWINIFKKNFEHSMPLRDHWKIFQSMWIKWMFPFNFFSGNCVDSKQKFWTAFGHILFLSAWNNCLSNCCWLQELLPDLHAHFLSQSFDTSMYASSWFLTLFTTTLTLPVACRVMDTFLVDGMEIIFRLAVAILALGKEDLLSLDMEGMLKVLLTPVSFLFR